MCGLMRRKEGLMLIAKQKKEGEGNGEGEGEEEECFVWYHMLYVQVRCGLRR